MENLFDKMDALPMFSEIHLLLLVVGIFVAVCIALYKKRDAFASFVQNLFKAPTTKIFKDKRYGR